MRWSCAHKTVQPFIVLSVKLFEYSTIILKFVQGLELVIWYVIECSNPLQAFCCLRFLSFLSFLFFSRISIPSPHHHLSVLYLTSFYFLIIFLSHRLYDRPLSWVIYSFEIAPGSVELHYNQPSTEVSKLRPRKE